MCLTLRELAAVATGGGVPLGGGAPAVQDLSCSLTGGHLALSYKWAQSALVPWDATAAELEVALGAMAPVGAVAVRAQPALVGGELVPAPRLCSGVAGAPFVTRVTFVTARGAVPPLAVTTGGAGSFGGTADVAVVAPGSLGSYGEDAFARAAWDADMVTGCHCDGYPEYNSTSARGDRGAWGGVDCAARACPSGVSPLGATPPRAAVQRVSCVAGGGTFSLAFRGAATAPLDFDATVDELRDALQDLPSVGLVTVSQPVAVGGARVCGWADDAPPAETLVTFVTELGPLPLLVPDASALRGAAPFASPPTLAVEAAVDGAGEVRECSGLGTCDAATGQCVCTASWLSSDGAGREGARGDCGARRAA